MIELRPTTTGHRAALACDSCSRPITVAASAVAVPWATSTALIVHDGACLDALRLQYPSTTRSPAIPLAEVLDELLAIRQAEAPA